MLYFAEVISSLFAKSSKFYQEHPANQTAIRALFRVFAVFPRFPLASFQQFLPRRRHAEDI
jgi:hypothetical protein